MSNGECKRCGGEGMGGYKHVAGGVCFACGRIPGGAQASAAFLASKRERIIGTLLGYVNRAKQEQAAGTLGTWLSDVTTASEDGYPTLPAIIDSAPVDVAQRARAAFARMGVTV